MMRVQSVCLKKKISKAIPIKIKLHDMPDSPEVYALGFVDKDEIPEKIVENPDFFIYSIIGTPRTWELGTVSEPIDYLVTTKPIPTDIYSFRKVSISGWELGIQELKNETVQRISEMFDTFRDVFYANRKD